MHSLTQVKAALWTIALGMVALVVEAVVMWHQGDYQGVFLLITCATGILVLVGFCLYYELNRNE